MILFEQSLLSWTSTFSCKAGTILASLLTDTRAATVHEVAGSQCDNDQSGLLLYIGAVAKSVVKMLLQLGWVPLKTEIVEVEAKRWAD